MHENKNEWSWYKQDNGNGATIFPTCCCTLSLSQCYWYRNTQIILCWSPDPRLISARTGRMLSFQYSYSCRDITCDISVIDSVTRRLWLWWYRITSLIIANQTALHEKWRDAFFISKTASLWQWSSGRLQLSVRAAARWTMPPCRWHSITAKFSPLRSSGEWSDYRLSVHL